MAPVTRIAPSPTGYLHLGTARTALFNYLFARGQGGTFIVRIEDTDTKRSRPEFEEPIIDGLSWLGMQADAVYRQSEHLARHQEVLRDLIAQDKAYLSREAAKDDPGREVAVVRLRNPGKRISFEDGIRGRVTFDTTELGDFVIARSIASPLYHLAVVVDDHDEGVTHVIRAEEHLSNTPRQILLHEALGFPVPAYAHLPLILAPDKSKLSKRKGAVSLTDYREQGYLPEALCNYLALLGWNPGTDEELFSLSELIERFTIAKVGKGGAVFDIEKLKWFNRKYMDALSSEEKDRYLLEGIAEPELKEIFAQSPALRADTWERIQVTSDLSALIGSGAFSYLLSRPVCEAHMLRWKKDPHPEALSGRLAKLSGMLAALPEPWRKDALAAALAPFLEEEGKGSVLWPMRYALSGKERSPDPFTLAEALGKKESLRRLAEARALLAS